ncbi:hypothetical protein PBRA_000386 [Plasmodiophora brassicae]|uniref:Uncharacterized protein n=1 Tax=Plasmodiophora brassicae TaxID=37360 RepID=A0A0G4IHC7_PLABS|nr:hypothetical protein PBRA_000386 [Plasmodiophora brassicae]
MVTRCRCISTAEGCPHPMTVMSGEHRHLTTTRKGAPLAVYRDTLEARPYFVMMKTTAEPRWKAPTRTAGAPQIALQFRRCLTKLEMLPPVSFYNISAFL